MIPSHPGTFIRVETGQGLSLSVTVAAQILGVRRATFWDLPNGKAALSPEMALGGSNRHSPEILSFLC